MPSMLDDQTFDFDCARQGQLALRGVKVPGLQTREAVKPAAAQSRQKQR